MHYYYAFMLTICSDLVFPELEAMPELPATAAITIAFGEVPLKGLDEPLDTSLFHQANRDSLWLNINNVGRFLIRNGREIIVDPCPGTDEDSLRLFILGSCMGALLMQRDVCLLHGNVVKFGNFAVSFVGNSGAGKSTLCGAFFNRNYPILADDICAINQHGFVLPSFPHIKLWSDAATCLRIETKQLKKIRPGMDKFSQPLANSFYKKPLPLKFIYVLNSHQKDEFQFTKQEGMHKLPALHHHTYRRMYLKGLGKQKNHLQHCVNIACNTTLVHIHRPQVGFRLDELVELIEMDINKHLARFKENHETASAQ